MTKQQHLQTQWLNLEEIVRKLEQGDVPLEEAIDLYKKGMELSHFCHEKLQNAEQQLISIVEKMVKNNRLNQEMEKVNL